MIEEVWTRVETAVRTGFENPVRWNTVTVRSVSYTERAFRDDARGRLVAWIYGLPAVRDEWFCRASALEVPRVPITTGFAATAGELAGELVAGWRSNIALLDGRPGEWEIEAVSFGGLESLRRYADGTYRMRMTMGATAVAPREVDL